MKQKSVGESLLAVLITSALLVALSGCDSQQGPAEKAGEKIDNAAEQTGEKIEEAGEAIQDTVQDDKK
jgi:predicted small secreted protein